VTVSRAGQELATGACPNDSKAIVHNLVNAIVRVPTLGLCKVDPLSLAFGGVYGVAMPHHTSPIGTEDEAVLARPMHTGAVGKDPVMATRTRTTNRVTAPVFKSKSDAMRAMFADGATVTAVAAKIGVGYAFAYGVAKRYGFATTAATRKAARKVTTNADGSVTVQTTAGPITVQTDGSIIRPKAARTPKA